MKNNIRLVVLLFGVSLLYGCIKYAYSVTGVVPEFGPGGTGAVAVASQDLRDYVVSGRNVPQLVGVVRGGFGNPVYMKTDSGRPLAEEMGEVISAALEKKGFRTQSVTVSPTEAMPQVQQKLVDSGADKLIHFQIKKWKSDTYNRIRLEYNLSASVMDRSGRLLAEKEISGDDNLGGAGFNIVTGTRKKVPEAFKEIMEDLFNAPEIQNALEH